MYYFIILFKIYFIYLILLFHFKIIYFMLYASVITSEAMTAGRISVQ